MADNCEEYLQRALHCRKMAEGAATADMRNNWLRLAENWLSMVAADETQPHDALYAMLVETRTGH